MKTIFKGLLSYAEMKLCIYTDRKYSEAHVQQFIKTTQRHTALSLELRTVLISILVENHLPDIKKQVGDNVVAWVGQSLLMPFRL